jgi:toxin CptA
MTSAPAVGFEYRPSRWVSRLFVVISALAVVALVLSGVPRWLQTVAVIGVVVACRQALRRLSVPVDAVGWNHASGWTIRGADGTDDPATLRSFRVFGLAILLRLVSPRYGALTLWLMPDNTDADIRRRLRMRLASTVPVTQANPG